MFSSTKRDRVESNRLGACSDLSRKIRNAVACVADLGMLLDPRRLISLIAILLPSFRNDQRSEAIGTRRQIELKEITSAKKWTDERPSTVQIILLSLSLSFFPRFYDRMSSPYVTTKGQKRSYDKSHFPRKAAALTLTSSFLDPTCSRTCTRNLSKNCDIE